MFQNFDPPTDPVTGDDRLKKLRKHMQSQGVQAVLVPHADEQRNEYLPANAERLAWLTGFTGSAGEAVVTDDRAVLFVDGRYTLQAADQIDGEHWEIEDYVSAPSNTWLARNAGANTQIGLDPWFHTANEVARIRAAAKDANASIKFLTENPVDKIWVDQPAIPAEPAHIHDSAFAGRTTREKMIEMDAALQKNNAKACVLTDPSSICWLFNIRGSDVAHTPITLAHAILRAGELPLLFIDQSKLDIETRAFLTQTADLHAPDDLVEELKHLSPDARIMLDPDLAAFAFTQIITDAGGTVVEAKDPARLPRAVKNDAEIAGARAAHKRDGVAFATFLAWLDKQPPGTIDEIEAAKKLEATRTNLAQMDTPSLPLKDISFDTISGSGPNGAIVHYRVTQTTNRILGDGELYLCDSGGQYDDGTTDITRTIAIGEPSQEQRHTFTLVLKGHIALSLARFPKGTRGMDLDVLARNALWQNGFDYAHGTGHGVGSYLSVHEGPQNISRRGTQELLPGMILSNEPGYYREGEFGIRIENLVLVRNATEIPDGDIAMLGFETLTLAPIDQRLIDTSILTDAELHWLNAYHGWVRREITPLVTEEVALWLKQATEPATRDLPAASA